VVSPCNSLVLHGHSRDRGVMLSWSDNQEREFRAAEHALSDAAHRPPLVPAIAVCRHRDHL
jgi:hypothetical protein